MIKNFILIIMFCKNRIGVLPIAQDNELSACLTDRNYNFVIWVVFFMCLKYNKNVIMRHNIFNKNVKECIYGAIDLE